jgi:hypothetical protein
MRRLLRILLNAATVLSLVLCVAMAVLWVRGYWTTDRLIRTSAWPIGTGVEARTMDVIARRGRLGIHLQHVQVSMNQNRVAFLLGPSAATKQGPAWNYTNDVAGWPYPDDGPFWKVLRWRQSEYHFQSHSMEADTAVEFSPWALVGVLGILPAAVLWKRSSSSRRAQGLCLRCGYDLRATPERCPECGTIQVAARSLACKGVSRQ